jgi:hypothetical protein
VSEAWQKKFEKWVREGVRMLGGERSEANGELVDIFETIQVEKKTLGAFQTFLLQKGLELRNDRP